ncbi:MAG TPA: ATPase, partial [Gammaproteobacteria bacterium]|nr:ATPase [Gammaproteobacteria bacterium]
MIITRIQSENFLKYRKLDLRELPEKGLITVGGRNESGKTTIGETLCFGLFGRTFTLDLIDPRKLIRWGAARCSVNIEYRGRDGHLYEVTRYLDDEGGYGARLLRVEEGMVLAKGPDEVDKRLRELNGFGYDEFIESFYLAQRELTTPHPHSHTIKVMAGVAPLTEVSQSLIESTGNEHAVVDA